MKIEDLKSETKAKLEKEGKRLYDSVCLANIDFL